MVLVVPPLRLVGLDAKGSYVSKSGLDGVKRNGIHFVSAYSDDCVGAVGPVLSVIQFVGKFQTMAWNKVIGDSGPEKERKWLINFGTECRLMGWSEG